jgi:hypothetical protein
METKDAHTNANLAYAVRLVHATCCLAGSASYLDDIRADLRRHGITRAIRGHDTPALFDWLIETLSFQGISDAIASGYMERHGAVRWSDIADALSRRPSCPKLGGTGGSTIAGITREPTRVLSPASSTPARSPATRCATAV